MKDNRLTLKGGTAISFLREAPEYKTANLTKSR